MVSKTCGGGGSFGGQDQATGDDPWNQPASD